ncbi:MAG: hypothetical protein ABIT71_23690 [Vicinamibacteraceae bacterium]
MTSAFPISLILLLGVAATSPSPLAAQTAAEQPSAQAPTLDDAPAGGRRTEGTIVSVRSGSITIRTGTGAYRVFQIDRTARPARPLQPGMRVAVVFRQGEDDDAPLVLAVAILPSDTAAPATAPTSDPVPPEVRAMETTVERQLRRYNAGGVAGVSVQPELIVVGGHVTFERIFRRSISVRPGLQLGFGEISTLLNVDVDVLYAIPGATRRTRWAPYVGAGPTIGFRHRSFEDENDDGTRFDFGDFDADNGFNFIVGMRNPKGAFLEMKATASGVTDVRLLAGVTF